MEKIPGDLVRLIKNTARRLDHVYGCCGNETESIVNDLLLVALVAQSEWRCA